MSTTNFAPFTRSPEHEDVMDAHVADTIAKGKRHRRWIGAAILAALAFIVVGAAFQQADAANVREHKAACAAAQRDLASLTATTNREADRQQFVQAAQGMVNAAQAQPGANWDNAARQWSATYDAQRLEDDYQRVLLERVTASVKVCAR